MSHDFYRRDHERERSSRQDDDGDVISERSRDGSRPRGDIQAPAVSRRTTEEWTVPTSRRWSPQSEPSTDPHLNNKAAKGLVATTGSNEHLVVTNQDKPLQTPHASTSKPARTTSSPMGLDRPADTTETAYAQHRHLGTLSSAQGGSGAPLSLLDSIASVLISFSKDAYSAAYARQHEEAAKNRLAAAEKTVQQIHKGNKSRVALIEQGEQDKKKALKLFADAKARSEVMAQAMSTAAMTAATRIVELSTVADQSPLCAEDAERIACLEATVSTLTKDPAKTTKDLSEMKVTAPSTSTEAAKVRVEIVDPLDYTVATTSKHMTSINRKVEALTSTQDELQSLMGSMREELKSFKGEIEAAKPASALDILPELYAKHETLLPVENGMNERATALRTDQNKLKADVDEVRVDIQRIKNENRNREIKALSTENAAYQGLTNLKDAVAELSARLNTKMSNPPPVNRDWALHVDRIDNWIKVFDQARKSDHKLLDSHVSSCHTELTAIKNEAKNIYATVEGVITHKTETKEFVFDHLKEAKALLKQTEGRYMSNEADFQKLREDFQKYTTSTAKHTPKRSFMQVPDALENAAKKTATNTVVNGMNATMITTAHTPAKASAYSSKGVPASNGGPQRQKIGLEHDISAIRTDYNRLTDEFRKTREEVAKLQSDIRTAIDASKANVHSIRALTQRYNNITTEDMVNAMLRRLERLYPHASQIQDSFDTVWKEIGPLREHYLGLHKALGDHVNSSIGSLGQELGQITAHIKKADIDRRGDYRGLQKEFGDCLDKKTDKLIQELDRLATDVKKNNTDCEDTFRATHKQLENLSDGKFAVLRQDLDRLRADVKKSDTEWRDLFTKVVANAESQRDTLKTEMSRDMEKLEEVDNAMEKRLADLWGQVQKLQTHQNDAGPAANQEAPTNGKLKLLSQQPLPDVKTPSKRSEIPDYLASWQRPARSPAKEVTEVDMSSDSSSDAPLSSRRSRQPRSLGADANKKRKRDNRNESPDVRPTQERQGSGVLRAKEPRLI